ncbi:LysR family transcriptional regulator [Paenibacillus kandeliae]|uniref:LysR family transcriptional regulator n=1 Tax=Paenibacillus kandeliae TaxID=3231269 RepID=UPI003457E7FA
MNIEQMHYIAEVARTGSLTRAAENCHITVTGVSRAITLFEKELGTRLFIRSRSGTMTTPEGENIIAKITTILNQIEELKRESSSYQELNNSRLRIASIPGPISLLIESISDMKREFPGSRFEIIENNTQTVLESVHHGESDIGLVLLSEQSIPQYDHLQFEALAEDRLILVCHQESALADQSMVILNDLSDIPLVLYNDPNILTLVRQLAPNSDILFKSNNVDALLRAVRANLAVTIGTLHSLHAYGTSFHKEMVTIPLQLPDRGDSYLWSVRSTDYPVSRSSDLFIRRFKQILATRPTYGNIGASRDL